MNIKLLKELYKQAETECGWSEEKFAELIVRECMAIVKSNTYSPAGEYDYSYSDENAAADERAETIYKEIAYSFGVEE
jgi:hypothetical protein